MIHSNDIRNYLYSKKITPLVIDVSERQESSVIKTWDLIGLKETPFNVPLSLFINFAEELISLKKFNQEILFICRSGDRSLQAVKALRRLGFTNVWNLDGGIALAQRDDLLNIA